MPLSRNFYSPEMFDWGSVTARPGILQDPSFLNNNIPLKDMMGGGGSWLDDIFGKNGWGMPLLGALGSLGNLYMGMQQYGLAKKALSQARDQFNKNYAAQRQTINTQLEDRQRARVASNPDAYESVGTYMDKNRIR